VDQTAKAQTIVTAAMGAWPDDPPVLTLVAADGAKTEITATSTSLQAVAEAINAGSAGVTATRVSAGKDGNGNDLFRLQLTAAKTGGSGAFTAYRGTAADVAAGTATDLLAAAGSASVSAAADATITLWPGSAAEQQVVSATNTFDDLLTGVDVLVTKAGADPVTVSVSRNATAAANTAASLMGKLVSTFATIAAQSKVSSTTASSGAATVSGGVFTGDSAIRQLKDGLMAAVVEPVDDRSLSSIGITVTREGGIAFDAEIFKNALEADPSGTQAMFATMAGRVENAASSASDSVDGYLSQRVTGQEDTAKRLGENISAWDLRLEKRRAVLQRQYTAMETALSGLNSQSTWLASQLASLNVSTGT
jgi:flagellar hook-associated protein 2